MSRTARSTGTGLRIGLPAVVFGVVDAVAVASGGRSLLLSLASGALLGGFVAVGLVLRDRFRARQLENRETSAAPLGSWSNPSRRQRVITRFWKRRHDRGQPPANPLGERRNRR